MDIDAVVSTGYIVSNINVDELWTSFVLELEVRSGTYQLIQVLIKLFQQNIPVWQTAWDT